MNIYLVIVSYLLLLISPNQCRHKISLRVAGGEDASEDQFPYVVSLRVFIWFQCTGVIISPEWILTAAHCVEDEQDRELMTVYVGGILNTPTGQGREHEIKEITIHPTYNKTEQQLRDDLALIRLKTPISFSSTVHAIKLGKVSDDSVPVTAVGWGATDDINTTPDILQHAVFLTMKTEMCKSIHAEANNLVDGNTQICIYGGLGKAVCAGDSGGPLIRNDNGRLVGIFSGYQDCTGYYPPLYVRLSAYIDFLRNTTALKLPLH